MSVLSKEQNWEVLDLLGRNQKLLGSKAAFSPSAPAPRPQQAQDQKAGSIVSPFCLAGDSSCGHCGLFKNRMLPSNKAKA